ncbi:MAG: hypothetical protein EOO06_00815 [Chitinophagaceae bacterium]|nr:MAG: hypothetical protein EOO06_00815 [Chitinophagaceae bacterium]
MSLTDKEVMEILFYKPKSVNVYDKFMEVGVTKVIEKQHGLYTIELIFEGDFKDEDIAQLLYKHNPAVFSLVGETECTIETGQGTTYTARFTRGGSK